MTGHSTSQESELITRLEAQLDLEHSSIESLLRLGQLYLCPEHDDKKAGEVLRAILRRDPGNVWGSYWFASYALYCLMVEEAILEALHVLDVAIEAHPSESGALYYMRYYLLLYLSTYFGRDFGAAEKIELLEKSVQLEPNWVSNRRTLAKAYIADGRIEDAISQLRVAQDNLLPSPDPEWDILREHLETEVTGRVNPYAQEDISGLIRKLACY